jgi:delta(3,5)-delta(2,4)-dienoyl-CoA isomerase
LAGQEVDVGLAADIGTLARLRHAVGSSSAFHELAYTARVFAAPEALGLGLVSRMVAGGRDAVVREALETAAVIAAKSPVATATTKTFLLHARDNSCVLAHDERARS